VIDNDFIKLLDKLREHFEVCESCRNNMFKADFEWARYEPQCSSSLHMIAKHKDRETCK